MDTNALATIATLIDAAGAFGLHDQGAYDEWHEFSLDRPGHGVLVLRLVPGRNIVALVDWHRSEPVWEIDFSADTPVTIQVSALALALHELHKLPPSPPLP